MISEPGIAIEITTTSGPQVRFSKEILRSMEAPRGTRWDETNPLCLPTDFNENKELRPLKEQALAYMEELWSFIEVISMFRNSGFPM